MYVEHTQSDRNAESGAVVDETVDVVGGKSREILSLLRNGKTVQVNVKNPVNGMDTQGFYAWVWLDTRKKIPDFVYGPHQHIPARVTRAAEAIVVMVSRGFLYMANPEKYVEDGE